MSEVKIFEVRDVGTLIPVMCIKPQSKTEMERYLIEHAGYGVGNDDFRKYVIMFDLHCNNNVQYNAFKWNGRTFCEAHIYIKAHWKELVSGQVIDVEYILGETNAPKKSSRERIAE